MHPYQIEAEVRSKIFIIAVLFSIMAARLLHLLIEYIPFSIPWWVETPSVLGFFGLFVLAFDRSFWKTKFIQSIDWLYIPNLNGIWETEILSSYKNFDELLTARVNVRQSASQISISLETEESISYSVSAILMKTDKLHQFELTYNYINKPKADSISTMNMHQGTVWLQISSDCKKLDGEYYSGRGRQNFGRLVLKRL